jgi:hypothetical protein
MLLLEADLVHVILAFIPIPMVTVYLVIPPVEPVTDQITTSVTHVLQQLFLSFLVDVNASTARNI